MLASVMKDINALTHDIKDQTRLQGTKIDVIDEDLGSATENVEQANVELQEKMTRERTGNKVLIWCVVVAIFVVFFLIFFGFVHKKSTNIIIVEPQKEPDVPPSF